MYEVCQYGFGYLLMIISASRRTDIPAFYSRWFINRLRAGYCMVPNPFDARQTTRVSLTPEDVQVIVFWTRNPRPLFKYLDELDGRGYCYYFQYTLMDNPRLLDEHNPPVMAALDTFRRLADRVGPQRLVWRYDPIVLSSLTPPDFHRRTYDKLAAALQGYTGRSVISLLDVYGKIRKRLAGLAAQGVKLMPLREGADPLAVAPSGLHGGAVMPDWLASLLRDLAQIAQANDMEMVSCAEELDLQPFGIRPGKCIDDDLIARVFGLQVSHAKDPGQRKACGCVQSKDIGMYDSCLLGCRYCYATSSFERARQNYLRYDPNSPSLY
jgi:hypothetical protein